MLTKLTIKQLKTRLDQLLKVVRYNTGSPETGQCCTCLKIYPIKELQAGHFIKRSNLRLKYRPTNLMAQCIRCNHYMGGCQDKAAYYVIQTHGIEEFNHLIQDDFEWLALPKKPNLSRDEYAKAYNYWLKRNREMEAELGVKLIPKTWNIAP